MRAVATPASSKSSGRENSKTRCIVVIDDEAAYVDILKQLMAEHLACPVLCFTNPRRALRELRGRKVGLIVTDYNMPGMTGLDFIAEAQKTLPGVPMLMITAYPVEFAPGQLDSIPALKAVVRKPFPWASLAAQIARYWPSHSSSPFADR